ncbi:glutathione S-transferase family protein [Ramlibacter albus]|uniref:Glutathione S-transferase family protein n=1 Tax=Ramlibacter albus TaxID=2079448 RepID=A0A923M683_9BURK|nr:glutathione S-transferase family protein [Ramlibacter albus]MBC5763663.1 glutathione S-transferase family protein [Ramlibacter albus]
MSLKLYYAPGACSFVPHVLLELSGAPFEPVLVKLHKGEQRTPEYLAINPRGQVPVLADGGENINQIVAIVCYLDAKFPQHGFLPRDGLARAKGMELLCWMNNTVHPTFTHVFRPSTFAGEEAAQADVKAFNARRYAGLLGELDAIVAGAAAKGQAWLTGDKPGAVDAYALTLCRWSGFAGLDPTTFTALWAHVQKLAAHPAAARVIEREKLQLNLYKAS